MALIFAESLRTIQRLLERFPGISMFAIKAPVFVPDASNGAGQGSKVQPYCFLGVLFDADPNARHDQSLSIASSPTCVTLRNEETRVNLLAYLSAA
jgi:hypothetical protein